VSGGDEAAVLQQVIRGDVAPPSRRRAGLTPEIDRVVMKAMEKSSSRRPLTMRQFLTDVAGLAVGAPSAGTGVQSQAAFAKTMMFAGGTAPDVSHLVNQAAAARAEANGSGPAAAAQPAFTPTPAPPASPFAMSATPAPTAAQAAPTKRGHGAAVAATMVAMPAASPAPIPGAAPRAAALDASMQPTPPPVSAARPPGGPEAAAGVATDATGAPVGKSPANFRETLWFKKGDVEQMVAEAKAKAQAARGGKASIDDLPLEETKPLEDRYVDDGSLTAEDRKKFSLRSGGPAAAPVPPVGGSIPGERMSESEMLGEIGGGKRIAIVVIAVAVVVALIAVLYVAFRGKSVSQSAKAITPVATPTAATPPAPSPAPAAAQVPPAPPPAPAAADHEGAPPAPAVKAEAPSRPAHAAQTRKHAKKRAAATGKKERR
jgi:hypothetical protein